MKIAEETLRVKSIHSKDMRSSTKVDGRHIAGATTVARELTVYRLFKGETIESDQINNILPCGVTQANSLIASMNTQYGSTLPSTIKQIGGFKGKDFRFQYGDTMKNIEMKSTDKKLSYAARQKLLLKPWNAYCEFLQGQLKNIEFQSFLGPYSESVIIKQYFEEVIVPFMKQKSIQGEIDWQSYKNVIYTMGQNAREKMLADTKILQGARNLIQHLIENKTSQNELVKEWKAFQNKYITTHRLNEKEFEAAVKKRLAEKDIWICLTKDYAQEIEGPQCMSLTFDKVKIGKSTSVLQYILELKKPSEKTSYKVPMEFRLHWKNIGQGIGNPNFMLK